MSVRSAASGLTDKSRRSVRSDASRMSTGRSQLHWKMFRRDTLAPHHIRILETYNPESLPESIIAYVDVARSHTGRFTSQREAFRCQVSLGQAFGPSAFFPTEVLPANNIQPLVSRCMVPSYSQDALPERRATKAGTSCALSVPRPGLGCGFVNTAFTADELRTMPSYLLATGTPLQFEPSSLSMNSALVCPFLSFERAFSQHDDGIDVATNQCAVDGAWSVRALQMAYARAAGDEVKVQYTQPVSFTCCIDNEVAIINYHWVDHAQTYCMAPIIRFDLNQDDHFDQLLIWVAAIEHWAVTHVLPEVKRAIARVGIATPIIVAPHRPISPPESETSQAQKQDVLLSCLKTDFETLPWHATQLPLSPGVSSTASWGTPIVDDSVFDQIEYPQVPKARSLCSDTNAPQVRFISSPALLPKSSLKTSLRTHRASVSFTSATEPAYEQNSELVVRKRLGHAMNEIEELQTQLKALREEMSGTVGAVQSEMVQLKQTMSCVIRKEKAAKARSPLRTHAPPPLPLSGRSAPSAIISVPIEAKPLPFKSVVTTPTDPRARPMRHRMSARASSGLQNVLTPIDTNVSAVISVRSPLSASDLRSPTSLISPSDSDYGEQEQYQPLQTFLRREPILPNEPQSARSEVTDTNLSITPTARTITARIPTATHSVAAPASHPLYELLTRVLASQMLCVMIPSVLLRILLIGFLVDYFIISFTRSEIPTILTYANYIVGDVSYIY